MADSVLGDVVGNWVSVAVEDPARSALLEWRQQTLDLNPNQMTSIDLHHFGKRVTLGLAVFAACYIALERFFAAFFSLINESQGRFFVGNLTSVSRIGRN